MEVAGREFRITCVERESEGGYWKARVGGVDFDRKHGSWMAVVKLRGVETERREALPNVAAALQERVRKLERGERVDENETVTVPTRENHTVRIQRTSADSAAPGWRNSKSAPAPLDPSMGPAEVAAERIKREANA